MLFPGFLVYKTNNEVDIASHHSTLIIYKLYSKPK